MNQRNSHDCIICVDNFVTGRAPQVNQDQACRDHQHITSKMKVFQGTIFPNQ